MSVTTTTHSRGLTQKCIEYNQRYALISVGNSVVVMELKPDRSIRELWPVREFKMKCVKDQVMVRKRRQPFADIWLTSKQGQQYDRLVYAMPGSSVQAGPNDFNGYRGFTVDPAPGNWSQNRDHLLNIICGGEPHIYDWVFNWCAALVQQPGRHAWTALVLRGGQGTGKGYFADRMLGALFHPQQYLHIIGANQLVAEFNEHLSGKALVFADETTWGGDPKAANKLKGLITEDVVPIHRKFLKMVDEPSALHIVIASNNDWPIAIEPDDRRFCVLDVSEARKQDDAYFGALRAEMDQGGLAAMLHDLQQHPIDSAALRRPPETSAKLEVKERTLSPEYEWWRDELQVNDGWWYREVKVNDEFKEWEVARTVLLNRYFERVDPVRRKYRSTDGLGKFFKNLFKKSDPQSLYPRRGRGRGGFQESLWVFPELEVCRRAFDVATGTTTEWSPVDEKLATPF